MSDEPDTFLRPFLARPGTRRAVPDDVMSEDVADNQVVRAYMMTSGAGDTPIVDLAFESMVSLSDEGKEATPRLQFERGKIARLVAQHTQSVAEIAANLRIPLGVTRTLCGEMVGAHLLEHHQSNANLADDVSLLTRLINGVRSL